MAVQRYVERVQKEEKRTNVDVGERKGLTGVESFYKSQTSLSGKRQAQPVNLLSMKGPIPVRRSNVPVGITPIAQQSTIGPWRSVKVVGRVEETEGIVELEEIKRDTSSPEPVEISKPEPVEVSEPEIRKDLNEKEPIKIEFRKFSKPTNLRK